MVQAWRGDAVLCFYDLGEWLTHKASVSLAAHF